MYCQESLLPVTHYVDLNGKTNYRTIDPTFPLLEVMGRSAIADTSYKLTDGDGKALNSYYKLKYSDRLHPQPASGIAVYPMSEATNPGNNFYKVNDTLITRNYFVDAGFCKKDVHYSVEENWLLDHQGKVKDIYTHRQNYGDTTWTRWNYVWLADGRLDRVVISSPILSYNTSNFDTSTIQMIYDDQNRMIGQYKYRGSPQHSVETLIIEWNNLLDQFIEVHRQTKRVVSSKRIILLGCIRYTYDSTLLIAALSFLQDGYTYLISENMQYDAQNQLVEHRKYDNQALCRTLFTYQENNKLVTRKEDSRHDYRYPDQDPKSNTETYSYNNSGRLIEIKIINTSDGKTLEDRILIE